MTKLAVVDNPSQDTATSFERDQKVANALEQISRVNTMAATPFSIKQALVHAFAEGGWRNGFRLMPEGIQRDAHQATSTELYLLNNVGRKLKVTVEFVE